MLLLGLGAAPSQAGVIYWGSSSDDALFKSDGSDVDGSILWEMGTFTNGFEPTSTNLLDWESNWKSLEIANPISPRSIFETSELVPVGATSQLQWVRDEADPALPDSNPNRFVRGEKLYIWVYSDRNMSSETEWALVTGRNMAASVNENWIVPYGIASAVYSPVEYRLMTADTVIFGGLNNVDGPGENFALPTFSLQTARVAGVVGVPEPSASLLGLLAMAGALLRRVRSC
jgi:hypothetical protein